MKDAFGLFTFSLKANTVLEIERFCNALKHIRMAVSWGGHESLIIPRCAVMTRDAFDAGNEKHRWLRMYVGLEDASYLCEDLREALDTMKS